MIAEIQHSQFQIYIYISIFYPFQLSKLFFADTLDIQEPTQRELKFDFVIIVLSYIYNKIKINVESKGNSIINNYQY